MIGILFESHEWSDFKLEDELVALGHRVYMIDMTKPFADRPLTQCRLLVSRVFASAQFRGNQPALDNMLSIIALAKQNAIAMINPSVAHAYEIDKHLTSQRLSEVGLPIPEFYAVGLPNELNPECFRYPCVIKPNCGGRSTYTAIVRSIPEARHFLSGVPDISFIVQEYLEPELGYITRVEVIRGTKPYLFKRSVGTDGLSSYHCGSSYVRYDAPRKALLDLITCAADALNIELGSFDIIEARNKAFIIDANSVTNVSQDCTELLGIDLMRLHAVAISERYSSLQRTDR